MTRAFMVPLCIILSQISYGQLKSTPVCPPFAVDILDSSVNKMYPESPLGDVMLKMPCYTQSVEEPSANGCAGVFFQDKGIMFYTYRDYIEINDHYKGAMSLPLMGAERSSLFKWFGLPLAKDFSWEAYQIRHGMLVVYFDGAGKINKLLLSSKSPATLKICE